jgi:hypothetical protein
VSIWTAHTWLRLGTMAIFCSNVRGCYVKREDFIEYLRPSQEDLCSMELGVDRRLVLNRIWRKYDTSDSG